MHIDLPFNVLTINTSFLAALCSNTLTLFPKVKTLIFLEFVFAFLIYFFDDIYLLPCEDLPHFIIIIIIITLFVISSTVLNFFQLIPDISLDYSGSFYSCDR